MFIVFGVLLNFGVDLAGILGFMLDFTGENLKKLTETLNQSVILLDISIVFFNVSVFRFNQMEFD